MKLNRIWAYFYMPILFLFFGYGTLYIVLAPVINFVRSSIDLILLNDAPTFNNPTPSLFDEEQVAEGTTAKILSSEIQYPKVGTEYGRVVIEALDIKTKMTFGDRPVDLRTGVGHYNGSAFPGELGVTLIGGHNTTDFDLLHLISIGDEIKVETNYATYHYHVTSQKVARFDDETIIQEIYNKIPDHQLILYTCSPADMIGLTDERLFVYANLSTGPLIDLDK